jgi:toxin ParE1/3/4
LEHDDTTPIIIRTARAEEDLIEIWLYIAEDNPVAADRLLDEIDRRILLLAENPYLGSAREDIAEDCRYSPVGNYLILYRIIPNGIEVVRVVQGSRRLDNLFR